MWKKYLKSLGLGVKERMLAVKIILFVPLCIICDVRNPLIALYEKTCPDNPDSSVSIRQPILGLREYNSISFVLPIGKAWLVVIALEIWLAIWFLCYFGGDDFYAQ